METVKEKLVSEYFVIRDKNTGMYFRGKGANRWGKYYNQATIYRVKGTAEHTLKDIAWNGEQAEIVPIQIIENGVTIQEWISVDEPPKEDGRYLLLFENGSMCDSIYEVKRGQFGIYEEYWNAVNGFFKVWQKADPTHWMPKPNIPKPPKGVQ